MKSQLAYEIICIYNKVVPAYGKMPICLNKFTVEKEVVFEE